MTGYSHCAFCRRLGGLGCEAFPDGIPSAIFTGQQSHAVPVDGDHGLRFVPRDDLTEIEKKWLGELQFQVE